MSIYNIQPVYNAKAIDRLKKGKREAWDYIKTIPAEFQEGAVDAVRTTLKRVK